MENVSNTLGSKAKVSGLTPNQEIEGDVEQFPAEIVLSAAGVGDPDAGSAAEIGAPVGIVAEEAAAETPENGGIEGVDVLRSGETHLRIGEVEDEVLALIADIVALEAEKVAKPVEEVVVGQPLDEGRLAEVADGAEGGRGGADFRITEGGVLGEKIVDGDDVVGFFLG